MAPLCTDQDLQSDYFPCVSIVVIEAFWKELHIKIVTCCICGVMFQKTKPQ